MEDPRLRTPAPLSPDLVICGRYSLQTGSKVWGQAISVQSHMRAGCEELDQT